MIHAHEHNDDTSYTIIEIENSASSSYSIQSVTGTIAVFIGDMLAGYIVEGALKYVTGFSYSDWVQEALETALKNPSKRQIFLLKFSLSSGGSGGSGSGSFNVSELVYE